MAYLNICLVFLNSYVVYVKYCVACLNSYIVYLNICVVYLKSYVVYWEATYTIWIVMWAICVAT